jgi:uncharacterized protein
MTDAITRPRPQIDDPQALERVVRRLVERFDPAAVFLFGSRARGDAGEGSDYDLLAVVPDDRHGERQHLEAVGRELGLSIDLKFRTQTCFEERRRLVGTLEHEVEAEGVRLYVAPDFDLTWTPASSRASHQVIDEWLRRAHLHIAAADSASGEVPDQASIHVQWAAEKLVWAALAAHGLRPAFGYHIGEAAGRLPPSFPLRKRLIALEFLSGNEAAFRYPIDDPSLALPEPSVAEVRAWLAEVEALKADFESWLAAR